MKFERPARGAPADALQGRAPAAAAGPAERARPTPPAGADAHTPAHPAAHAAAQTVTRFERDTPPGPTGTRERAAPQAAGRPRGRSPLEVLAATLATASSRPWDPLGRLPPALRERLGPADVARITDAVSALQRQVREHRLDHVPVFGYLSLRTHNFAELGKRSQDEVVMGRDVVPAALPGHDIDVVASSVVRGTPEHPGAVAGLAPRAGSETPGVVLKLPLARAEELLSVVLARELFAEGDLADARSADGKASSNAMYLPVVKQVRTSEGTSGSTSGSTNARMVPALVFMTNLEGAKALNRADAFGDDRGLTLERMAWLFAGQGGLKDDSGRVAGGPSVDYWQRSYLEARRAAGQSVDPKIAAAIELSRLHPQQAVVDRLLIRTDRDARLMVEALRTLFAGVAAPLAIRRSQNDDAAGLSRTPAGARGDDAPARLLEVARALERAGKIRLD